MPDSSIPSSLGNPGPRFRSVVTVRAGPKRLTDDGELVRFHVPTGGMFVPRPRHAIRLDQVDRILLVRLDFVGDWIITTPFLDELRRRAPQADITAVVIDRAFVLAENDPALDRVISIAWARGRRIAFGASNVSDLATFVSDYISGAFDLALVPRWDTDFNGAALIAHGSRAPRVVGFSERSTPAKAAANRGDDRFYTDLVDDRRVLHEAERALTLLGALGVADWRESPVRAPFNASDRDRAANIMRRAFDRPVLAVAPFVDSGRRELPTTILAPMIRRLRDQFGLDVAIVAAPIHTPQADAFAGALGDGAVALAGQLSLREVAAFLSMCSLAIAMDSGPAHIAAGVGTPVVVFSCHPADGPAIHPQSPVRFAPRAGADMVLVLQPATNLPPCGNGCERDRPHCITQLDEAEVWPRLEPFVANAVRRHLAG